MLLALLAAESPGYCQTQKGITQSKVRSVPEEQGDSMEGHHIFKYISRDDLEEMLEAFHQITKLNVDLISTEGKEILRFGAQYAFCREFIKVSTDGKGETIRIRDCGPFSHGRTGFDDDRGVE